MTLEERIKKHEGLMLKPYRDTLGKLTIGIGRNLDDVGISEEEAYYLFNNDLEKVKRQVNSSLGWILGLDEVRQGVLYEMAFQMGIGGLLGFKRTLVAIQEGRYEDAADNMLDSRWAIQTPHRAKVLSEIMRKGY